MTSLKPSRRINVKFHTPELNVEEFYQLTDILFELFKRKHATCARALDISTSTWRSWESNPPTWSYWNHIIRYVILHTLSHLEGNRGATGRHRREIMKAVERLRTDDPEFLTALSDMAYNTAASTAHLRRLLSKKGMYWDKIRLPANSGGYSEVTLRKAAAALEVVKTSEGYGKNKRSYWRLPTELDE